jgi:hypothetical protein
MAAIAFDPLGYTRELEASGVPRHQAEVHAKAMTATFLHNFDSLVTRDYLDTRFTEFETRITSVMDRRFVGVDKCFVGVDKRFAGVDKRFAESDAKINQLFAELRLEMHREIAYVRGELADLKGKLNVHGWMLALLVAGIFLPMLQRAFL